MRVVIFILALLGLLLVSSAAFLYWAPVFGGKPDQGSLVRIQQSVHHQSGIFVNLQPTKVSTSNKDSPSLWQIMLGWLNPSAGKNPETPLPSSHFDAAHLANGDFVWFGHSTVLMRQQGVSVLTDPVFYRASPVPLIAEPFAQQQPTAVAELPFIDIVLISHDHYDHLDYRAIQAMDNNVGQYFVLLGVKGHLQRWGIDSDKVYEFDWYEARVLGGVTFVFAPSRHFSGRTLTDRFKTLWGSWLVLSDNSRVYFSGDGGYSDEFVTIGERYGPFDIAFIENGAYNQSWSQIHLFPEQAVQAALDLNATWILPIHWAKFDLANHRWTDPIVRLKVAAAEYNLPVATPALGQIFDLNNVPQSHWWQDFAKDGNLLP